jgi:hypothetical protein
VAKAEDHFLRDRVCAEDAVYGSLVGSMNRNENGGVSTFSATCVSINMMIGAGMLALPYGFAKGGIAASLAILVLICFWMIITCLWEGRSVIQCGRVLKAGSKVPEGVPSFIFTLLTPL